MGTSFGRGLPLVQRRLCRITDPSSRRDRRCDATGTETPHQELHAVNGDYWLCAETGQMSRGAVPDHLSDDYDEHWAEVIRRRPPSDADVAKQRRWLQRFEPYRRTGRLFEVGCGLGILLRAARDAGWDASGNELSPLAADHARRFADAPVDAGPIEACPLEAGAYDVILCANLFEHLAKPADVLARLAEALRPGGGIYIHTLNGASLSLVARPRSWIYYAEGHLIVPTVRSMRAYGDRAGLDLAWHRTHGFSSSHRDRYRSETKLQRRLDKLVASVAGRLGLGHRVECVLEKRAEG